MKLGKSRVPREQKHRLRKEAAVLRVASAETQDYVSQPQGLEEIDDEEMEKLSFISSAVMQAAMGSCTCATTSAKKRA